jgi:hypothetical protein
MVELTTEQETALSKYPKKEMSQAEFDALPEYSMSTPTQDESGLGVKKWKKRTPILADAKDAIWFYGCIEKEMNVFYHIVIKSKSK